MKVRSLVILFVLLALLMSSKLRAQVTGPCTPFPCPAPPASQIDSALHEFDTTHFVWQSHTFFEADTLAIKCGWIYQFHVEAGAVYEWNTKISHGVVPTVGNNQLRTKITLFYDDFSTSAVVSDYAVDAGDVPGCAAAGLAWRANYTGTVGIMVTRGDIGVDFEGDFCACNNDVLYLKYNQLEFPSDQYFVIWGRYGTIDTLPCDDEIHLIYESGSNSVGTNGASGDYSNNENGFLVLYPDDETSKLKLWGDSKLQDGDTLFIYNGDLSLNPNLIPYDTIVGQQQLGSEDSAIFMSAVVNQPITLRMQSDSSCSLTGLELQAKCCMNPGMPTDLNGSMPSDTTALLTWHPAEGNEIVYNWTLYTADSVYVSEGNTQDTFDIVQNLSPNECYYFSISVLSACSNEQGSGEDEMDVVYSNIFCFPYFVTLGNQTVDFNFNTDSLFVPHYYVMVTDEACTTVEQIFVPQLYFGQGNLYVPNTITPSNDDGLNDYFQLYYHGDVDFEKVLIYNRWGTLVFTSTDINFKWNGSVNGEIMYNNVYTYLLYYYDYRGTEHVIKGFLLVL